MRQPGQPSQFNNSRVISDPCCLLTLVSLAGSSWLYPSILSRIVSHCGLYPRIWRRINCGSTLPSTTWFVLLHVHFELHLHFDLLLFSSLRSSSFSALIVHCCWTTLPTALLKLCKALFTDSPASDIAPSLSSHCTRSRPFAKIGFVLCRELWHW